MLFSEHRGIQPRLRGDLVLGLSIGGRLRQSRDGPFFLEVASAAKHGFVCFSG